MAREFLGTIVERRDGASIPDAYLEIVLDKRPSCLGAAMVKDGAIQIAQAPAAVEIEDLKKTMGEGMPRTTYFFGKYPTDFIEELLQPFHLLKDEQDQVTLVAFLEGDFSKFALAGSDHSNEFFCVQNYLIPKVQQMYRLVDGNMAKLVEELKQPITYREVGSQTFSTGDGTIVLVASVGDPIVITKNEKKREFPWGWTSDTLGYTEAVEHKPDEKPVEEKKGFKFGIPSLGKASVPASPPAPPLPPEDKPEDKPKERVVKGPKPPVAPVIKEGYELVTLLVPKNQSSKDTKKWFRSQLAGELPADWSTITAIQVQRKKKDNTVKSFTDIPRSAATPPAVTGKDTATHHIASTEPIAQPTSKLPIIPADEAVKLANHFMKRSDVLNQTPQGDAVLDLEAIANIETKLPTFADKANLKNGTQDSFGWSHEVRLHLVKEYPHSAAVLMGNLTAMLIMEKKKNAKQATPAAPSEAPVEQKPASPPARSGFQVPSFGRKTA